MRDGAGSAPPQAGTKGESPTAVGKRVSECGSAAYGWHAIKESEKGSGSVVYGWHAIKESEKGSVSVAYEWHAIKESEKRSGSEGRFCEIRSMNWKNKRCV